VALPYQSARPAAHSLHRLFPLSSSTSFDTTLKPSHPSGGLVDKLHGISRSSITPMSSKSVSACPRTPFASSSSCLLRRRRSFCASSPASSSSCSSRRLYDGLLSARADHHAHERSHCPFVRSVRSFPPPSDLEWGRGALILAARRFSTFFYAFSFSREWPNTDTFAKVRPLFLYLSASFSLFSSENCSVPTTDSS
jgi:hypothetical protein